MSIRTRDVPPSQQIQIGESVYPVVTLEDLSQALMQAAVVLDLAGGCLGVVLQRLDTGVPNEKVTTRALVTWQDRTNAKPQVEPSALESGEAQPVAEQLEPLYEHPPAEVDPAPVSGEPIPRPADPTPFDDGIRVDPEAVDVNDAELRAAIGG